MKKLIYIANARIPTEKAHGLQIMEMCSAFTREGFEVELVLPRRINRIKEDPFKYYEIDRNFKIKNLPCLDLITLDRFIGHFGLWLESMTFLFSVFFYVIFRKAGIIYMRDRLLLPISLIKNNIIFEAHNFPKNYYLYYFFLKRLRGAVTITQKLKDLFTEYGISVGKILVAPDGVDLEKFQITSSKFQIRERFDLPQDKKIVLYAGHLYAWKGARVLANASKYLPDDAEIYFVGGTTEDIEKFRSQVSDLKFQVHVIGHRPHVEIPYWLKAADILVLPNSGKEEISRHWTSPMKMFEYMAAGRPIVASGLPSLQEILDDTNSVLVEPDNPEKLAEGIKKILNDHQLAKNISERALEEVRNYTWQKRAGKIINFIKENER